MSDASFIVTHDDDGAPLAGAELEEFEREWAKGNYQRALREQVRTGELTLFDHETGEPANVNSETITFEKDGQTVTMRAEGRPLRVEGFPRTPGIRGFFWPEVDLPSPRRCPRCTHWIPTDEAPGEYPGARSRIRVGVGADGYASRSIEICSACGHDEVLGRGLIPTDQWPIT